MVKRYTWDEEGYPPDGMELVAAADYDALARDLAVCKTARDGWMKASDEAQARIRELEAVRDRAYMRLQCADVPRDPWHWEVSTMLVTPDTALEPLRDREA